MPKHCYPGAPYGCGHFKEHSEAAKKGWESRRRAGMSPRERERYTRAESALSVAMGETVTQLHTHPTHPNEVRYKQGEQWFSMSREEFADLEKWARGAQREQEREYARMAREQLRDEERAIRERMVERAYRYSAEEYAAKLQAEEYTRIRKRLRRAGVAPSRQMTAHHTAIKRKGQAVHWKTTFRPVDYGEWEALPKDIRRRNGRYNLDSVQEIFGEEGALSETALSEWQLGSLNAWFDEVTLFQRRRARMKSDYESDMDALKREYAQAQAKRRASQPAKGKRKAAA